jgi:hypothetical protein
MVAIGVKGLKIIAIEVTRLNIIAVVEEAEACCYRGK